MAARMGHLLAGLAALEEVEGFLRRRPIVDDGPDRADHADRVGGLPDVPAHVDARRPRLDRVVRELARVELRFELRAARDDDGHAAPFDHLADAPLAALRPHQLPPALPPDP